MMKRLWLLATFWLIPLGVHAHSADTALGRLSIEGDSARLDMVLPASSLAASMPQLGWHILDPEPVDSEKAADLVAGYAMKRFHLSRGGAQCEGEPRDMEVHPDEKEVVVVLDFLCPASGIFEVESDVFADVSAQYQVILTAVAEGQPEMTVILNADYRTASLDIKTRTTAAMAWQFMLHGVSHILAGPDHVLFVLGLFLVSGGRRKPLLISITGFTLAHTATLALAALGRLSVASSIVEPIIGASIAWLGIEALERLVARRPLIAGLMGFHVAYLAATVLGLLAFPWLGAAGLLVFAGIYAARMALGPGEPTVADALVFPTIFGLFHGMGFAGPLLEIHLSTRSLVVGLVSFNLGVEAGQLMVIGVALAISLLIVPRLPAPVQRAGRLAMPLVLVAVGAYWLIQRTAA